MLSRSVSVTSCLRLQFGKNVKASCAIVPGQRLKHTTGRTTTWNSAGLTDGPGLEHFISNSQPLGNSSLDDKLEDPPYIDQSWLDGRGKHVYFDVYGCQMNVNDTEVVWSILKSKGYSLTTNPKEADLWLLVTCSIREGAEAKIWKKLNHINSNKKARNFKSGMKIGLLGCMAERLKTKLLDDDRLVDVVAGPDSYRDLPRLLATAESNNGAINVMLSADETYADIMPVQLGTNKVTGYVSIQRGCDNMCSYCIVPFTRGRERSRPVSSIVREVEYLVSQGVKEVTLLGQNVNSYRDTSKESLTVYGGLAPNETTRTSTGFKSIYRPKVGGVRFADLLQVVAEVDPEVRIRFTSPHPKDFPDEVLHVIKDYTNVCNNIHLPAQSGNSRILEAMRRGYTREAYLDLVDHIRSINPGVTFSSDFIAGFCSETEEEFKDTLSLIDAVNYSKLFLFSYSLREKTHAHRKMVDDVPLEVKNRRTKEMIDLYRSKAEKFNKSFIGSTQTVLIEGGRTDSNIKVIFPRSDNVAVGDYCHVDISDANSQSLKGSSPGRKTTLCDTVSSEMRQ